MIQFENGGRLVQSLDELPNLRGAKELFLDLETTSFDPKVKAFQPYHGHRACGICITADDAVGAWYVPIRSHRKGWNIPLKPVLSWLDDTINSCTDWINHNVKFDAHFLKQDNVDFNCRLVDTMTLSKIIDSDRLSHDLDTLSRDWLEKDIAKHSGRLTQYLDGCKSKDYGDAPGDIIGEYGCQDVITNRELWHNMIRRRHEQTKNIWETEILLTPVLFDMEVVGLHVDKTELMSKQLITMHKMLQTEEELHNLCDFPIRPHTNADCFEVLCTKYGLPVLGWSEGSKDKKPEPSFDKETLFSYLAHPTVKESNELTNIVAKIQQYRKLHTFNSNYLEPYQKHQVDNVMHPDYNQIIRTGRMSCRRPSAQTLSYEAKELAHPPEGMDIASWDYCLPAGTLIPTPYGDKPIEEVAYNLLPVLSYTKRGKLKFCDVSRGARVGFGAIYKITFDDGSTYECTNEHGFLTIDGDRINCCDLKSGDRLKHVKTYSKGAYPTWGTGRYQEYKHKLSMEYFTGELNSDLYHVHHIDEDKENWHIDNLELMDSFDHFSMHGKKNYSVQDHTLRVEKLREALKHRRAYKGSENPNWKGGKLIKACATCGGPITCWYSQTDAKTYCSEECRKIGWKKTRVKKRVELTCEYCGKKWEVLPSKSFKEFCSRDCANKDRAEHRKLIKVNYKVAKVEYARDDYFYSITVPETGHYVSTTGLVNFNSQIEFRLIVHYINDQKAIKQYSDDPNTDFHQWVADMGGIKRKPAKTVNFTIAFGGGKKLVVERLSMEMELVSNLAEVAKQLVATGKIKPGMEQAMFKILAKKKGEQVYNDYHARLPGIRKKTKLARDNLVQRGFVFNAYGRQRHLPDKASYRAFNTVVQSCAADVIKERTVALAPRYNKWVRDLGIQFFASVHDETAKYQPKEVTADLDIQRKLKSMWEGTAVKFRVPMVINYGVSSKNWAIASNDEGEVEL